MKTYSTKNLSVSFDIEKNVISSLKLVNKERLVYSLPIFSISFINKNGENLIFNSTNFLSKTTNFGFEFSLNNDVFKNIVVQLTINNKDEDIFLRFSIKNVPIEYAIEYIETPNFCLPDLKSNGNKILWPYNEGVLVEDISLKENSNYKYTEPTYPSKGSYGIFPNMVFAQFISYHFNDCGLYIGMHDKNRGLKQIDFRQLSLGVNPVVKIYCGCNYGESYAMDFDICLSCVDDEWESSAIKYRNWFENNLPSGVKKIEDNKNLPDWYYSSPLILTYPVRGSFDMDNMTENAFYPYTNALPFINEIKEKTGAKIMALLMHWEGTAPWAPPYVWPPYGDENNFNEFKKSLHSQGDLLGVYCSGFSYTIKSNLIPKYNKENEYNESLKNAMCISKTGEIQSVICQGQRKSYDICPASPLGKEIINQAYEPLFSSGLDYVQILDQNHGGGQYLCFSKDHGHPPTPGKWMTENMKKLLSEWNKKAPNMLFGCESASAEPYLNNLQFSDNRFELNYVFGIPVSLYSFIFHEYLRNFMGNQVGCPFNGFEKTVNYRLAYSFCAGDSLTLTLSPDKTILPFWGFRHNDNATDTEETLSFIKNLTTFYNDKGHEYLLSSKRIIGKKFISNKVTFTCWGRKSDVILDKILSSAYEKKNGDKVQIFVNPFTNEEKIILDNKTFIIPALSVLEIKI